MNLFNKSIFALSAVGMLGLWSCSSEETLQGGDVVKGQQVPLTITVNRGDARTRTILSENEAAGLDSKWVEGDKVFVYNRSGIKVGELTIESGWDSPVGVFSGLITAEEGSKADYAVWYFKEKEGVIYTDENQNAFGVEINLAYQDFASAADLSAMEVLGTGDLNLDEGFEIAVNNGKASVTSDVTLESKLAMARFSLAGVGLPEGTKGTLNIYNADGIVNDNGVDVIKTKTIYKLSFSNGSVVYSDASPAGITVENAVAGQDVFVAFAPGDYRLGFNFTTADGEEFVCEYANSTKLTKGVYYNNGVDAEGNVLGAPLYFKHKDGRDNEKNFCVRYFRNFSVEDNQNMTATWTDWYRNETAADLEVEIKSYEEALKDYPLDSKYYEFQNWCPGLVYGLPTYQPGENYTLSFDPKDEFTHKFVDPATGVALIWIDLHANWVFNYYLRFELDADAEVIVDSNVLETKYDNRVTEGGKLNDIVTHVNESINVSVSPILPNGITISKPGYTFKGWQRKDTGAVVDGNSFTHGNCIDDIDVTLVPVWEEIPKTVSTSGYGHGDFN